MFFNTSFFRDGSVWVRTASLLVIAIYVVSIPPKWAGEHIAGLVLLLMLLFARREDWQAKSIRAYAYFTLLWLVPVSIAVIAQHIQGLPTASEWVELLKLTLRTLGVGLGVVFMLQRGWITLPQLSVLVIGVLTFFAVVALADVWPKMVAMEWAWRSARIHGLIGNPNPLAHFLALMLVLAAGVIRQIGWRPMLLAVILIGLVGIYWTGTRGGLVALFAGAIVIWPPSSWRRGSVYLLLFVAPVVWYVVSYAYLDASLGAVSNTARMIVLDFSVDAFLRAPMFGWGMDSFMQIPGHRGVNAPHNMLLDLVLSAGLFALVGWVVSTLLLGWRLIRSEDRAARTLLALFVTTVVIGNLEHSLLMGNQFRGMWILVVASACHVLWRDGGTERVES